jgi:hypothetical protein
MWRLAEYTWQGETAATEVLAALRPRDFHRARVRSALLTPWRDYKDFIEERNSQFFGYGTAGVTACFQLVPFAAFERWVRLTGARADLSGLDHFAAHWRWRKSHAGAPTRGRSLARPLLEPSRVQEAGVQVVNIVSDGFARWLDAVAGAPSQDSSPSIDAFAGLVVETCIALRCESFAD